MTKFTERLMDSLFQNTNKIHGLLFSISVCWFCALLGYSFSIRSGILSVNYQCKKILFWCLQNVICLGFALMNLKHCLSLISKCSKLLLFMKTNNFDFPTLTVQFHIAHLYEIQVSFKIIFIKCG